MAQLPQNNNGPNGGHLLIEPVQRPHIVYPGSDPKPVVGVRGRRINVYANTFALRVQSAEGKLWWQHAVTVLDQRPVTNQGVPPPLPPKAILRKIWRELEECAKRPGDPVNIALGGITPVYDGRALCYTSEQLPSQSVTVLVTLPDQQTGFNITISNPIPLHVGELTKWFQGSDASQGDVNGCLAALNTLFHHGFALLHPSNKTTFFINEPERLRLPHKQFGGLLPVRSNLRRRPWRRGWTSPQLDTTSGAFVQSGSLLKFVADYLGVGSSRMDQAAPQRMHASAISSVDIIRINRLIKGGVIDVELGRGHGSKKAFKIRVGLTRESAISASFNIRGEERSTNVESYFRSHYGIHLREPRLPCVEIKPGVLYPLELCSLRPGHKHNRKLSAEQQLRATEYQQLKPAERLSSIRAVREGAIPFVTQPNLDRFQVTLAKGPVGLYARVLAPPNVDYRDARSPSKFSTSRVSEGSWSMHKRGSQTFTSPARITSFGVILIRDGQTTPRTVLGFLVEFFKAAQQMGMRTPDSMRVSEEIVLTINEQSDMGASLLRVKSASERVFEAPCDLIFAIVPSSASTHAYNSFKREGMVLGIATQAIRVEKMRRTSFMLFNNLAVKVSAKLGGVSFGIAPGTTDGGDSEGRRGVGWLEKAAPLVFAADLTHTEEKPSIAVVVASCDREALHYQAKIAVQPLAEPAPGSTSTRGRKKEVVEGMHDMVLALLKDRFAVTQQIPPKCVLFYRDGVSDSEWAALLTIEIPEIKRAFETFKRQQPACANWQPQLTHIVTVKRHHIRLFPSQKDPTAVGRNGNVRAGTVVDEGVVDARAYDWYGVAHGGILGTSRPTRYIVMTNEGELSIDDLQTTTNTLSHICQRTTGATSIPAPVHYADIICSRVRGWMPSDDDDSATASSASGSPQARAIDFAAYQNALAWVRTGLDSFSGGRTQRPVMWWL